MVMAEHIFILYTGIIFVFIQLTAMHNLNHTTVVVKVYRGFLVQSALASSFLDLGDNVRAKEERRYQ